MSIPSVDLANFLSDDPDKKAAFVEDLGRAYEEVGFVAVKNHGLSHELIDNLYRFVQQFFSLPLVKKKEFEISGLAGQRGYTSFGSLLGGPAKALVQPFILSDPLVIRG